MFQNKLDGKDRIIEDKGTGEERKGGAAYVRISKQRIHSFLFSLVALLLCSFLFVNWAHAQRFKGGIVGGFNFSQIDGDNMVGYNRFGLNGGGYVATVLSDRWLISTELLFSQRGSRLSSTEPINGIFDRIKLDFLEVPVLINFKEWKFHVQAGFSYARLFDTHIIEITGADITDSIDLNEDLVSVVSRLHIFSI